ncbi:hypothetical protein PRA30_22290, partial [Klebsiella pneumoniae]|nr:hypothetical protein [Klebsiella pneumoniae]
MVSGFAMPKIWRQIAMDISVTAVKTGRRRYLTLIMIFITVVICYVDRANLAVASAHIQEEFGIREGANKQVISSQADSLIKISRIWADF